MTDYDPSVIQSYADRLYRQARRVVIRFTAYGIILGLLIDAAIQQFAKTDSMLQSAVIVLVLGLIFYAIGRERSFYLRYQAQSALCQMKIEENTR